ncbi:MAG TPA: alpha/beta hydrolase [Planctomycetota bacterium]
MLHREELGHGPRVVALHSGGMSARQWRRLAEQLAPSFRVVLPDLLGSGANPPWPEPDAFDVRLDVAALGHLLDALGEPVHLVGHSYGGFLALTLARQRPADVRSLAVYDPTAFGVLHGAGDAEGLADLERARAQAVFLDDRRGGGAEWYEAFVDYWNGPGTWRALPAAAREGFLRTGRKVYLEARSLLAERTPAEAYAGIAAPTLLLGGERSPAAARRVLALLAAAIPGARAHLVSGAGHMGPISQAEEVNRRIAQHLAGDLARAAGAG